MWFGAGTAGTTTCLKDAVPIPGDKDPWGAGVGYGDGNIPHVGRVWGHEATFGVLGFRRLPDTRVGPGNGRGADIGAGVRDIVSIPSGGSNVVSGVWSVHRPPRGLGGPS